MIVDKRGMFWAPSDYYDALVFGGLSEKDAIIEVRRMCTEQTQVDPFASLDKEQKDRT